MSDNNEEKQLEVATVAEQAATVAEEVKVDTHVSDLEATLAAKETELQAYASKVATLEETLANLQKELAGMNKEMEDMKKKEKIKARKEKLGYAGFEGDEIEEALSLYETLADDAFDAVVNMHEKQLAKVKKMGDQPKKKFQEKIQEDEPMEEDNPKASVAEETTEQIFEEVKTTEATLVAASDEVDEVEATRASVAEWLTNNVLRK